MMDGLLKKVNFEPGSIYAGVPARCIRDISQEQVKEMTGRMAESYITYSGWYR